MGKAPCCSKVGLHKGSWSTKEDMLLTNYIQNHGEGHWRSLPQNAGLLRCGKSCRLRWMNYLRPGIKRGNISNDEEDLIIRLHKLLGNRWSLIAGRLPGRTDNEIKNYFNTHLIKKLKNLGNQLKDSKVSKKGMNASKKNGKKPADKIENGETKCIDEDINKIQVFVPKPIRVLSVCLSNTTVDTSLSSSLNNENAKVERTISNLNSHYEEDIQEKLSLQYSDWELPDGFIGDLSFGFEQINSQIDDDQVLIDGCDFLLENSKNPTINSMIEKVYDEYLQLL